MNNFNLLVSQAHEVQRKDRELDTTPSFGLLADEIASKVKNILKKFADNNDIQLGDSDNAFLLKARYQIQKKLRQQVTMCKVIPVGEINKYLSFDYDIGNFMLRKADLDELVLRNYYGNIIETLYKCLRLDYEKSPFSLDACNRMAIVELKIDNFACRVPLDETNYNNFEDKKFKKSDPTPYTGIGWTKDANGVPEFYVTIANEKKEYVVQDGKPFTVGFGKFPIMAFDTNIYVADRDSNCFIKIASYDSETLDGCQIYEKFERSNDNKTEKIRNIVINEERIDI